MHVHGNQFDPRIEMYAQLAATKTEAKREAERTRRKLLNAASVLAGEYAGGLDCVVRLSGNGGGEEHEGGRGRETQDGQGQDEQAEVGSGEDVFSGWA